MPVCDNTARKSRAFFCAIDAFNIFSYASSQSFIGIDVLRQRLGGRETPVRIRETRSARRAEFPRPH